MDAGKVFLDEPFRSLWAGRDPFVAVEALDGEVYRELEGRRTLRTEVAGRGYFVKIHRGIGWAEIAKNLATLRLPVLGAANEWLAIQRLRDLGVDSMRAVAFGLRGRNPARQLSFIITEELAPTISLEDYCLGWAQHPPSLRLKRALLVAVAQAARRMHLGGVNHRDFYICHFLLHLQPATDCRPAAAVADRPAPGAGPGYHAAPLARQGSRCPVFFGTRHAPHPPRPAAFSLRVFRPAAAAGAARRGAPARQAGERGTAPAGAFRAQVGRR